MATNNFKAFGIGAAANVTSQTDYEALAALLIGFQSGKASSAQINKALRQSSTMAYVLAQFISDSASVDVLDNGTPATILANLKAGLLSAGTGRLIGVKAFSTAGTFNYTPTPGAKSARVYVTGAGGIGLGNSAGASAPPGAGGGAGGTAIKFIKSLAASYSVVVGAPATTPSRSGSSSFGSECAATGGNTASGGSGGDPGVGSGGDVNLYGGWGSDGADSSLGGYGSGDGGASYWGGGQKAGTGSGQGTSCSPGGGGGGNQSTAVGGRIKGMPGIVYIEEYA